MSASIAATAGDQTPHGGRETSDPLACLKSLVDGGGGECAKQPDPEHDRKASDLIFQGHPLLDQLLARDDERADAVGRQKTSRGRAGPRGQLVTPLEQG
jgi:hypothetical protein